MRNLWISTGMLGVLFVGAGLTVGCDYTGDFLFAGPIDNVPAVIEITAEDGGAIEVATVMNADEVKAATIYAEVGPNAEALPSGATLEFIGTGREVCVFVDPETVYWNQSVGNSPEGRRWRQPDNVFDDGDIDLQIGLSIYYRGTPGKKMGGFEVQFEDGLENDVEVNLVSCQNSTTVLGNVNLNAHAGRATAEYCSIASTLPGVRYTVAMEAISLPRDDARLAFGALIADGPCEGIDRDGDGISDGLLNRIVPRATGSDVPVNVECLIQGENLLPDEAGAKIRYGYEEGQSWPDSEGLEDQFCNGDMREYCNQERRQKKNAGVVCDRIHPEPGNTDDRCFCGDSLDSPNGGALDF